MRRRSWYLDPRYLAKPVVGGRTWKDRRWDRLIGEMSPAAFQFRLVNELRDNDLWWAKQPR